MTFDFLDVPFMQRSEIYPGSVGAFRYRLQRTGKREDGRIQAWVYENICFERAQDVETETFPWTEDGMAALRAWLEEKLLQRGGGPYRIWDEGRAKRNGETPKT